MSNDKATFSYLIHGSWWAHYLSLPFLNMHYFMLVHRMKKCNSTSLTSHVHFSSNNIISIVNAFDTRQIPFRDISKSMFQSICTSVCETKMHRAHGFFKVELEVLFRQWHLCNLCLWFRERTCPIKYWFMSNILYIIAKFTKLLISWNWCGLIKNELSAVFTNMISKILSTSTMCMFLCTRIYNCLEQCNTSG